MALVQEVFQEVSHKAGESLHALKERACDEWDRNVVVKDLCGRAEAAALALENLIRETQKPGPNKQKILAVTDRTPSEANAAEKKVQGHRHLKSSVAWSKRGKSSERGLGRAIEASFHRQDGVPLFANIALPPFFGVRKPDNHVNASKSGSSNAQIGHLHQRKEAASSVQNSKKPPFAPPTWIPGFLSRESAASGDSTGKELQQRKEAASTNQKSNKPPFAAASWIPGFLKRDSAASRDSTGKETKEEEDNGSGKEAGTWLEEVGNEKRQYYTQVNSDGSTELAMKILVDKRPLGQKLINGFHDKFFPVGYPESVAEGYQVYSQWRAVQHFTSAILGVLSTQSVLFAAGLRPTPAQATVVSWVLKEGMQHVGKLVGSSMGPRMDADPKKWRIYSDIMYDFGAALEIGSPLVPSYFLPVAGAANLAKGIALLAARSTRLPIYTAFAKHGNVGDLYAKGEALSVLSNVAGMWLGIQLASGVCGSVQGKLLAFPVLSGLHVFCVAQEMRAAPMNFLNAQRTALLVEDYVKHGVVRSPPELRYREKLIFPPGINTAAGSVRVGAPLRTAVRSPKDFAKLSHAFRGERFLLNIGDGRSDLILHRDATGEDVLKGWLLAAYIANGDTKPQSTEDALGLVKEGYKKLGPRLPSFLEEIKRQGWQVKQFHEGAGKRAVW